MLWSTWVFRDQNQSSNLALKYCTNCRSSITDCGRVLQLLLNILTRYALHWWSTTDCICSDNILLLLPFVGATIVLWFITYRFTRSQLIVAARCYFQLYSQEFRTCPWESPLQGWSDSPRGFQPLDWECAPQGLQGMLDYFPEGCPQTPMRECNLGLQEFRTPHLLLFPHLETGILQTPTFPCTSAQTLSAFQQESGTTYLIDGMQIHPQTLLKSRHPPTALKEHLHQLLSLLVISCLSKLSMCTSPQIASHLWPW